MFTIFVPPLRDRKADLLLLADHFLEKFSREHGKVIKRISTPAIDMLMSYHWPGNVRELENALERAVLVCDGAVIHGHHLPPSLQTADASGTVTRVSLGDAVAAYERDLIQDALKTTRGNRAKAARLLDTTERILNYKVRNLNVDVRRFKASEGGRRPREDHHAPAECRTQLMPMKRPGALASSSRARDALGVGSWRLGVKIVSLFLRRPLWVIPAIVLAAGCGKKGPPLAPIVRIPAAITTIQAQRAGSDVFVTLTVPDKNVDSSIPVDIGRIEVYGYTGRTPPPRTRWAELGDLVATIPVVPPPIRRSQAPCRPRPPAPWRRALKGVGARNDRHRARHTDANKSSCRVAWR